MSTPSKAILSVQLAQAKLFSLLQKGADAHDLPVAYVLAIASRETNMRNILGDFRNGEYHGVGVVQIDIQHSIARSMRDDGTWKTNPWPLIDYGCAMLAKNILTAKEAFPSFIQSQLMKVAASGYNCGMTEAIEGSKVHGNSDFHTTGGDYGKDVLARTAIFAVLL